MSRSRISLGPTEAKMDAALIRNLQRLCGARADEITRLTAAIAERDAALDDAKGALAHSHEALIFCASRQGLIGRRKVANAVLPEIDAALATIRKAKGESVTAALRDADGKGGGR